GVATPAAPLAPTSPEPIRTEGSRPSPTALAALFWLPGVEESGAEPAGAVGPGRPTEGPPSPFAGASVAAPAVAPLTPTGPEPIGGGGSRAGIDGATPAGWAAGCPAASAGSTDPNDGPGTRRTPGASVSVSRSWGTAPGFKSPRPSTCPSSCSTTVSRSIRPKAGLSGPACSSWAATTLSNSLLSAGVGSTNQP